MEHSSNVEAIFLQGCERQGSHQHGYSLPGVSRVWHLPQWAYWQHRHPQCCDCHQDHTVTSQAEAYSHHAHHCCEWWCSHWLPLTYHIPPSSNHLCLPSSLFYILLTSIVLLICSPSELHLSMNSVLCTYILLHIPGAKYSRLLTRHSFNLCTNIVFYPVDKVWGSSEHMSHLLWGVGDSLLPL